ncbi:MULTISPECIES: hypothetical protein [unclassified Leisingera]|uniref:hypothetical protein n=1 Tax=unclassified Leisingera TaxID=2614906 RepID=UPI001269E5A9|nr:MULTISPECIES: hypothetical protein [unclassified Leisingera]
MRKALYFMYFKFLRFPAVALSGALVLGVVVWVLDWGTQRIFETSLLPDWRAHPPEEGVVAVLVSAFAIAVSVLQFAAEKRREVALLRYEAVRSKRAIAKAIRAEILAFLHTSTAKTPIKDAHLADLGRLSREASEAVLKFYWRLPESGTEFSDDAKADAKAAIICLDKFLEDEWELNKLKIQLAI